MKHLERRLAGSVSAWTRSQFEQAQLLRLLTFAILLIAVFDSYTATAQSQPADAADRIRGTVVNSVTHGPVPRALVSSPNNRFAMLTDEEGRFEFTVPRAEKDRNNGPDINADRPTSLLARKPGFLTDRDFTTSDLSTSAAGKDLTITLVPEALIVGRVTLPTSEAPDSIFLQVYRRQVMDGIGRWVPAGGTQSRSDGGFRIADLPAGTYKVLTRELLDRDPLTFESQGLQYGYPPAYSQNAPDFKSAGTIQVSAGMTGTANLTLAKQPYYRVHLPVANAPADGGLNVNVYAAGREGPGFSLGYDNQEQAIEGMLPNGTYTIEAFSFGQTSLTGLLTITVHGAAVLGPSMVLLPAASIQVTVDEQFTSEDPTGAITFNQNRRSVTLQGPRRYLNVILQPADDTERLGGASLRPPTRQGDEALVIENARPGRYWVRVMSTRGYAASVRSGNVDLQHQPLVVGAGGATSPIEIIMRDDTAQVDGTVEGITQPAPAPLSSSSQAGVAGSFIGIQTAPVAPAHVYCVPLADSGGQFTEVWVSPDGSFASPPLAPGAYRLLAFDRAQSALEYRNPEAMQIYDTKGHVVRLVGGQKEHVRLQLVSTSE